VARVEIIGKPGCHLCADAEAVVAEVCAEVGADYVVHSILDDPVLADRYWEQIPVVFVDGRQHDFWRVDQERLRKALTS
jgi:glutaredoxin